MDIERERERNNTWRNKGYNLVTTFLVNYSFVYLKRFLQGFHKIIKKFKK